ncbi:hypothetical protein Clacol_005920 [Clathrus columnatus]|uniref:Glycoside hydrolase family 5 protein n=1 Tax=Clathrus columnatus TaxID=1419009 RepID=A0AAV5AAP8_9AGAM|nr:hypothetical protein Clacol_005920 [Clathrus columnatus]
MWSQLTILYPILLSLGSLVVPASSSSSSNGLPVEKVYGVNLGSWLVLESWMLPNEWAQMGGESCSNCEDCAASEWSLTKKLGQQQADKVFLEHWTTWFTSQDVEDIANAGLNTVRIPLGFWIIEDLVDRSTEFYKRGLSQLKAKNINALLDFHAMPGVSASQQMFAGNCTTQVEFYQPSNYFRALQWAGVMTFLSHADPDFSKVFAIEAVNEPLMNSAQTPGYGEYLTDFTLVVRAVELSFGIFCPDLDYSTALGLGIDIGSNPISLSTMATSFGGIGNSSDTASGLGRVAQVLISIIPIIQNVANEIGMSNPLTATAIATLFGGTNRQCLHTTFMDALWQNQQGFNPAQATQGPALFDDHLYYSFGGVADPNAEAYLESICNLPRVEQDTASDNLPMVFGEWALSTNFDANDTFLTQWADAQKLMYSQSSGWIFWSFKIENNSTDQREWDYFTALEAGHFTHNPADLNDPNVCDNFRS